MLNELNYDVQNSNLLKNLKITRDIFNKIEVVGEDPSSFNLKNFKFPNLRKLDLFPKFVARLFGKLLWVKASINKKACVKCMLCIRACPVGAIQVGRGEYLYADTEKCISCFYCHEMCPRKAIGFKKSILAKIFIKEN